MALQVQLFEGNLGSPQTSDEETYDAALAHIAHGLRTFTPASVRTAGQLMESLDNKREPATGRSAHLLGWNPWSGCCLTHWDFWPRAHNSLGEGCGLGGLAWYRLEKASP